MKAQGIRLCLASGVVAGVCVAPLWCDWLIQHEWVSDIQAPVQATDDADEGAWYGFPEGYAPEENLVQNLFERLGGWSASGVSLPHGFTNEVFSLEALDATSVSVGEHTVGFVVEKDVECVQDNLSAALEEQGWERVNTSQAGWSYVRDKGTYRWVNVCWTAFDDATTVVVSFQKEEADAQEMYEGKTHGG